MMGENLKNKVKLALVLLREIAGQNASPVKRNCSMSKRRSTRIVTSNQAAKKDKRCPVWIEEEGEGKHGKEKGIVNSFL